MQREGISAKRKLNSSRGLQPSQPYPHALTPIGGKAPGRGHGSAVIRSAVYGKNAKRFRIRGRFGDLSVIIIEDEKAHPSFASVWKSAPLRPLCVFGRAAFPRGWAFEEGLSMRGLLTAICRTLGFFQRPCSDGSMFLLGAGKNPHLTFGLPLFICNEGKGDGSFGPVLCDSLSWNAEAGAREDLSAFLIHACGMAAKMELASQEGVPPQAGEGEVPTGEASALDSWCYSI